MNIKTISRLFLAATILVSFSTNEEDIRYNKNANVFDRDSNLYYEIGGARRINRGINTDTTNIKLGVGGNIGYSCGKFDIGASFRNIMDDFKNGVDDVTGAMANTANSAIRKLLP